MRSRTGWWVLLAVVSVAAFVGLEAQSASQVQVAPAPHPSVQFAAGLLKGGQTDEAIASLRPHLEADPRDCRALGLMVVAYLQQHDAVRGPSWLERLQGVPECEATAAAATRLHTAAGQRAELAKALAIPIGQGDLKKIEDEIARAERATGPLPIVRAYVEALKGEFPLLENSSAQASLPAAFVDALRKRKTALDTASADQMGAHLSEWTHGPLDNVEPFERAAWQSEGYRIGRGLNTVVSGPQAMERTRKLLGWYAQQIRNEYNLAPLNKGVLEDLMTLAFLSGAPQQIEAVGSTMKRAHQNVSWIGVFTPEKEKDYWELITRVTLDFNSQVMTYEPLQNVGPNFTRIPRELIAKWSLPFSQVKEITQPDIKFGVLKATGYRAMGPAAQGVVINGRLRVPLPAKTFWVGAAYTEIPVRQTVREYGAQLARLLGVPDARVKLVNERPGKGLFTFLEIWSQVSSVVGQATGKQIMPAQWADLAAHIGQEAAVQEQLGSQAMDVWERAKLDPLLGRALNVGDVTAEIDRLLQIAAK